MAVPISKQRAGLVSDLTRRYMRDLPAMLSYALRGDRTFEGAIIPKSVHDDLAPVARKIIAVLAEAEADKILGTQEETRQKVAARKGPPDVTESTKPAAPARPAATDKPEKPAAPARPFSKLTQAAK